MSTHTTTTIIRELEARGSMYSSGFMNLKKPPLVSMRLSGGRAGLPFGCCFGEPFAFACCSGLGGTSLPAADSEAKEREGCVLLLPPLKPALLLLPLQQTDNSEGAACGEGAAIRRATTARTDREEAVPATRRSMLGDDCSVFGIWDRERF